MSLEDEKNGGDDELAGELQECMQAVIEFARETDDLLKEFQLSVRDINGEFKRIDASFNKHGRQKKKYSDLQTLISELRLQLSADDSKSSGQLEEIEQRLHQSKQTVDALGKSKRKTGSLFISLIMGHVSVRLWNEGDKLRFKQEYNRFKGKMLWIFLFFPLWQTIFGFTIVIHQLQSFFLFYYYASLAVRENILSLNGSRIESWWIYHHYITLMSSLLFLLITQSHPAITDGGGILVNYFMVWQSIVMFLQSRYQHKRHYTRKALAKKSPLDVVSTEVIDERPHDRFQILIPTLYLTYAFQFVIALFFTYEAIVKQFASALEIWQMSLIALCWFILPIGNLITLLKVLYRKKVFNPEKVRLLLTFRRLTRFLTKPKTN